MSRSASRRVNCWRHTDAANTDTGGGDVARVLRDCFFGNDIDVVYGGMA